MLIAERSGRRVLSRQRLGSMDSVMGALCSKEMTAMTARQFAMNSKEWRALAQLQANENDATMHV